MVFGIAFLFGCLGVMFFLHFRKARTGEASLIRRWVNAAGETGPISAWREADTFLVELPEGKTLVRLNALDTPDPQSLGGAEALLLAKALVGTEPVRVLEFRRNNVGDIVGEVYNSENVSLNEELMKAGLAWYYEPDAPNNPYYKELNNSAIQEKRGLWEFDSPRPPWETSPRDTAKK